MLQVPNTFRTSGIEGVVAGMSYDLVVSLERHEVNPDQVTLKDKLITIVEGAGKGQTAKILDYDPETRTYTLDRDWVGIDETSRFEIAQSMSDFTDYQPQRDSYDVVLTSRPNEDVVIDVAPRRTRTYNSDRAFDPAANFGEADEVQVRVATNRAHFELSGVATAGERWIVTLGALDLDPDHDFTTGFDVARHRHAADDDRAGARQRDQRARHRLPRRARRRHARLHRDLRRPRLLRRLPDHARLRPAAPRSSPRARRS